MQNVLNTLKVLEALGERGVAGVSELARDVGLPKTTVQRALGTLHQAQWIRPANGGLRQGWELTSKVLQVARFAGAGDTLRDAALPVLQELNERTGESIHLLVRDGDGVVLVERLEGVHPVRTVRAIGSVTPLHAGATGKAILAQLPDDEVDALVARGLQRLTPSTITDPDDLRSELEQVRARGYAVNEGESWVGLCALGAAVCDAEGTPVAAVSISAPADRIPPAVRPEWGALVADAARRISERLGGRPATP